MQKCRIHPSKTLVKEVIIGLKVLKQHQSITLDYDGKHRLLNFKHENESNLLVVCSNVKSPTLFQEIDKNKEPIKMPSTKYSNEETNFIEKEVKRLQKTTLIICNQ